MHQGTAAVQQQRRVHRGLVLDVRRQRDDALQGGPVLALPIQNQLGKGHLHHRIGAREGQQPLQMRHGLVRALLDLRDLHQGKPCAVLGRARVGYDVRGHRERHRQGQTVLVQRRSQKRGPGQRSLQVRAGGREVLKLESQDSGQPGRVGQLACLLECRQRGGLAAVVQGQQAVHERAFGRRHQQPAQEPQVQAFTRRGRGWRTPAALLALPALLAVRRVHRVEQSAARQPGRDAMTAGADRVLGTRWSEGQGGGRLGQVQRDPGGQADALPEAK